MLRRKDVPMIQSTVTSPKNIVVFGASGVGKSSLINLIAGQSIAATSNDATGCTLRREKYEIPINGTSYTVWDTAGLDEGPRGTVPAESATENLRQLLQELNDTHGIHLLLYCVRASHPPKAMLDNYTLVYSDICRKEVPIVAVVTGLEKRGDRMADWWKANKAEFTTLKMHFDGHACVTALNVNEVGHALQPHCRESQQAVRFLITSTCAPGRRTAERTVRRDGAESTPIVALYDLPENPFDPNASIENTSFEKGRLMDVGGNLFLVYRIRNQCLRAGTQFKKKIAPREANLLIVCASVHNDPSASRQAVAAFYGSYGGGTQPLLIVVRDALSDKMAREWWDTFDKDGDGEKSHREHDQLDPRNLRAIIHALPPSGSPNAAAEVAKLQQTIQSHQAEVSSVGCFRWLIGWFIIRRPRSPKLYSKSAEGSESVAQEDCLTSAKVWLPWRSQSRL